MNRTHNPLIAMNRNERSVYSVFTDRIEAYSVIELTEIHAYELCRQNEFPVIPIGKTIRIPRKALFDWIERRSENANDLADYNCPPFGR